MTLSLGLRTPTRPPTEPIPGSEKQAASSRMQSGWKMQSESMEMTSFGFRVLHCVADCAGLAAVGIVASAADADVGEVALRFEHPLEAVVDGAVVPAR